MLQLSVRGSRSLVRWAIIGDPSTQRENVTASRGGEEPRRRKRRLGCFSPFFSPPPPPPRRPSVDREFPYYSCFPRCRRSRRPPPAAVTQRPSPRPRGIITSARVEKFDSSRSRRQISFPGTRRCHTGRKMILGYVTGARLARSSGSINCPLKELADDLPLRVFAPFAAADSAVPRGSSRRRRTELRVSSRARVHTSRHPGNKRDCDAIVAPRR